MDHINLGRFIEWKYFTLFCDDGNKLAGALTRSPDSCDVWLAMYGAKGKEFAFQKYYSLEDFVSTDRGHFRIRDNFFLCRKRKLFVTIKEKDLELELEAKPVVSLENMVLQHDVNSNLAEWTIPFLKMDCKGYLTKAGKKQNLSGYLFHDQVLHNFGVSFDTAMHLRYWIWGVMYSPSYSILFVDINHTKRPFKFLCVNDSKDTVCVSSTTKKGHNFDFLFEKEFPKKKVDILYDDASIKVYDLVSHGVDHGGFLSRVISKVMKPKHHYLGKFSFNGEEGDAYLESCRFL